MFRKLVESAFNEVEGGLRGLSQRYPRLEPVLAGEEFRWLKQSIAFALASIDERMRDDEQALVRPLVAQAIPECLRPRPSSTIAEVPPTKTHAEDALGAILNADVPGLEFPLPFRVMWSAFTHFIEVRDARVERVHAHLQVLRLALGGRGGVGLGAGLPERVRFFVHLEPRVAIETLHALRTARDPIKFEGFDGDGKRVADGHLPDGALRWVRVDTEEPPLVSAPCDRFRSGTLLRDLLLFPESFLFFEIMLGFVHSEKIARLELTLPLGRVVPQASTMSTSNLRLSCAPASNEYVVPIVPLAAADGPEWEILAVGHPHAEILHLRDLHAPLGQGRVEIDSFEAPKRPMTYEPDRFYHLLRQTISRDESRTELRLSLATTKGFRAAAPGPLMEGEALVSDGGFTETLGLGDVAGRNITRVCPSMRAILSNYAARMNAYARMAPHRLAQPPHLAAFLGLHAPLNGKDRRIGMPNVIASEHQRMSRLIPGAGWQNGDHFTTTIATPSCTDGEAWLIGHVLSRALAERNDLLRFSRLTLERGRKNFAEYEARYGARYPSPLG